MTPPNNYNPFMPFGMNPYMTPTPVPQSQAPKTPQQIEAETRAMNEQYRNAYGMMASMGQAGPQLATSIVNSLRPYPVPAYTVANPYVAQTA